MEFLAESVGLLDIDEKTRKPLIATQIVANSSFEEGVRVLTKHVQGKVLPNSGDIFTGRVDALTGDLLRGERFYKKSQEWYDGPFQNGLRHGKGAAFTSLDGAAKFLGSFRDDSFYEGTYVARGYTYTGFFSKNNKFEGKGKLAKSNGSVYSGSFKDGEFHGKGELLYRNGDVYRGIFVQGKKQGKGKMHYRDGRWYDGHWADDQKHGEGLETYPTNIGEPLHCYKGAYQFDRRHGTGTLTREGIVLIGPWNRGTPVDGPGWTILYRKQTIRYEGEAASCRPHGQGTLTAVAADSIKAGPKAVYSGSFVCGMRHGEGRIQLEPTDSRFASNTFWLGGLPKETDPKRLASADDLTAIDSDEVIDLLEEAILDENTEKTSITDGSLSPVPGLLDAFETSFDDLEQAQVATSVVLNEDDFDSTQEVKYGNGDIFVGCLDADGKKQGHGVLTQKILNATYDGQWKDSKRHGKGTLWLRLFGIRYEGEFDTNAFHGEGKLELPDGSTYVGGFRKGVMHGAGTFIDATNRSEYTGDFVEGTKHGAGKERYEDGRAYIGSFECGRKSGTGELFVQAAEKGAEPKLVYRGEWENDFIYGIGKRFGLTTPCPGSYEGEVREGGLRHGHGTFLADDGFVLEGQWCNDEAVDGDWAITAPDGSTFYGAAKCNNRQNMPVAHGFGTHNDTNGDFYSGSFVDGLRHGCGLCVFSTGEQWDGKWVKGKFVKYGRERP